MIKATGIVRKVDVLGRVVLPIELRRTMDIEIKDPMAIYVDQDSIILQKYEPACIFCGSAENTQVYKGKIVCQECALEMGKDATASNPI